MSAVVPTLIGLALLGAPKGVPEAVTLTGEVVPLAEALDAQWIAADAGPIAARVALKAADVPLPSDSASRALFQDERLGHRPVAISGRRFPGVPYLQVATSRVEVEGSPRTPEDNCDVCTIRVRFPQACPRRQDRWSSG